MGILSLGGLLSCGIEKVYFMDHIRLIDYGDTGAIIELPSDSDEGYRGTVDDGIQFDSFIIFYRIYISGESVQTGRYLMDDNSARSNINATLNSDYINLYSYTDTTSTSVNTANLETTFGNRRYFLLNLVDAETLNGAQLGSGSLGSGTRKRLEVMFSPNPNSEPTFTIQEPVNGVFEGKSTYIPQRAIRNENLNPPLFDLNPLPDRRFLNGSELYNVANVTNGRNADTATYSGSATPQYTYVSMYIAARGTNIEIPPYNVYSQPTFIGIFRLADAFGGGAQ